MKYLLDDNLYEETKNIAQGRIKKSPFLAEFSDWFLSTYSGKVLNVQFVKPDAPAIKGYRLYVILETTEDYQRMCTSPLKFNKEYILHIANEFRRIAVKHNFASEEQFVGLWVVFNDFSMEAKTDANRKAFKEADPQIMEKYPKVWEVSPDAAYGTVVFYHTEKDIIENQSNGISKTIADDYYSILKKYDELNYFTRENMSLRFDSKENLDKNFAGSLFHYFR